MSLAPLDLPVRRVLVPAVVSPRAPALGAQVHDFDGRTMGTTWRVRLVAAPTLARAPVSRAITATLEEVVAQMSTWEPGSDLCRFNRAEPGAWHALPEALLEVLACAQEVARLSDGAFDATAGAIVEAWGFGPMARTGIPDADSVRAGHWRGLELDLPARRARRTGDVSLDLSAIAKGYAVDLVARRLEALGWDAHLVEVGGELRGSGVKPGGQPWWVQLEEPADGGGQTLLALHGLAVATSGDYRRWFEHAGTRYSHTIDPRDGRPIRHGLASVTVLHRECMHADAWATALNVLGPADGPHLADALGLAARFVVRAGAGFEERTSAAFDDLLQ